MTSLPKPQDAVTAAILDQLNAIGVRRVDIELANANSSGFIAEDKNDSGVRRLALFAVVDLDSAAGQAGTLDIGVAGSSEASADDLIDGLDATATGEHNSHEDGGTNGGPLKFWEDGEFVTVSEGSGDADGIGGTVSVFFIEFPSEYADLTAT